MRKYVIKIYSKFLVQEILLLFDHLDMYGALKRGKYKNE